ncbi:hypothetical protein RALTA_B1598 [Cupriavidus taiwanensis LMG 19424]|uniref:Uncharacterized protein n=1 Tax=Cupriavidus taiwanensis (strain DSM 17343 / BCRC 17206 / CCUG 44338 / CIP 107171 / LMG 19424 / R1) TaxID=977880 RepID=B3RBB8_CUPTR|nr:hypothetical protein RALTA_B1598 [Cupriavidus taiwanensis LMG 19424]
MERPPMRHPMRLQPKARMLRDFMSAMGISLARESFDRVDHPPATRRRLRPRRDLWDKESCHEYRLACWSRGHHSRGTQLLRLALGHIA